MIEMPLIFYITVFMLYAAAGMAIGALCGWIVSLAIKRRPIRLWKDALLGLLGFWVGFVGTTLMPWHENTITERLAGGTTVTTTMKMYQHPIWVAVVIAALFPSLHELYRFRSSQTLP